MRHSEGFLKLVQDAKSRVKQIDYREIKKRLDAGEKLILVDTREDLEWAKATSPARYTWEKGSSSATSKSPSLITARTGSPLSRRRIPLRLSRRQSPENGCTNLISIDGGWRGWTESGYPVTKD